VSVQILDLRRSADIAEFAPAVDTPPGTSGLPINIRCLRKSFGSNEVLHGIDLYVRAGEFVAVVGRSGCGKSTLLRLIAGVEPIYKGFAERSSSVSWPLPFGDYLVTSNTVATNIRFVSRLYGMDDEQFLHDVAEMAGISEFLNEEVVSCPRFVRPQLTFALAMAVKFDIYLFDDNLIAGEKAFKEKATQLIQAMVPRQGFVLASNVLKDVTANCDIFYILDKGHVTRYDDAKDAEKHFKSLAQGAATEAPVKQEPREQAQEDYSSVLGI
jgi:capsular polysaccharide transport system ATP-binding protein